MRAPRRGVPVAHGAVHAARRAGARPAAARGRRARRGVRGASSESTTRCCGSRGGTRAGASGSRSIDFQRSGYMEEWVAAQSTAHLHTARALDEAWEMRCDDPELAAALGRAGATARTDRSGQGDLALLRRRAGSRSRDCRGARRRCSRSTTGCTSSPTTDRRSKARSRCSGSSRAPTTTRARSRCSRWSSACSRPATSRAARVCSRTTAAISRAKACRCAWPTRCGAARWSARAAGGPDLLTVDWFAHADQPIEAVRERVRRRPEVRARDRGGFGRSVVAGRDLAVPVRTRAGRGRCGRPRRTTRSEPYPGASEVAFGAWHLPKVGAPVADPRSAGRAPRAARQAQGRSAPRGARRRGPAPARPRAS